MSIPDQPRLDGFCVEKGVIRQFVAMPLGSGYSAEEQLTGKAEHGGIQLLVHPLKKEAYRPHRMQISEGAPACMLPADHTAHRGGAHARRPAVVRILRGAAGARRRRAAEKCAQCRPAWREKGDVPLPENEPVAPTNVVPCRHGNGHQLVYI